MESPIGLYNALLFRIYEDFGEKEKDCFEFWFRGDLPKRVLEDRKPLEWFKVLEQRGKLSWDNVSPLVNFLRRASLGSLLSEVRYYQARIGIIVFFQTNLQARLPKLCLGTYSIDN